ncbi:hypothetical protein DFJ74DRAFT_494723 [Hyaloraphidium curvatum]|nr:hypothetical protein DFJ74DRAFT_494723 [Hyaloraphidium curvatum]
MPRPEDAIVLEYGDVVLRKADLHTLEDRQTFLTDTVIEYAMERLELEGTTSRNRSWRVKLLRPSMVHLLAHSSIDSTDVASLLGLTLLGANSDATDQAIFLPCNDQSRNAVGGTHWSLLVLHERCRDGAHEFVYRYYDSMNSYNEPSAQRVRNRLSSALASTSTDSDTLVMLRKASFASMVCPQQANGFDCGIFLVAFVQELVGRIAHGATDIDTMWELASWTVEPTDVVSELLKAIRNEPVIVKPGT